MMSEDKISWHRKQVQRYRAELPVYESYATTLEQILKAAARLYAPFAIVESRAKTIPSFAEKALRKAHKYDDPVRQLTDLCGARVITQTLSEVTAICEFIRDNFQIDEINSEDKLQLLDPTQFTYLSVHYVVQLKRQEVLEIAVPEEIGEKKAEIQVRTLLQHAWAGISHDRLYKNDFKVPDRWMRESNRLAAVLEEVDRDFDQFLKNLDIYATYRGAYMTQSQMEAEIASLKVIFDNEDDPEQKIFIARRIAAIARAAGQWQTVIDNLQPFGEMDDPAVLRELGKAFCFLDNPNPEKAERYLNEAAKLDPEDSEIQAALGFLYEKQEDDIKARHHYAQAFQLKPENPYYMASFVEYEVYKRGFNSIELLKPMLRKAVDTCRQHADVNIELPWAYFTMGKCHLLLNEPYEGLNAYAKALQLCVHDRKGIPADVLHSEMRSLNRLAPVSKLVGGFNWFSRLLLVGTCACNQNTENTAKLNKLAFVGCEKSAYFQKTLREAASIAIVAGSCGNSNGVQQKSLQRLFKDALDEYKGVIISGGTRAGIGGVVGWLSDVMAADAKSDFISIGYLPRALPHRETRDGRYHEHLTTEGTQFSALEPLQMWIDLLAAGVEPSRVKLIGVDGGRISAFEYRLAAALGATVGILTDRGGASSDLLKDPVWNSTGNLCFLPFDRATLRAFVTTPGNDMPVDDLESAAEAAHNKYLEENRKKPKDASNQPWKDLPEHLKESNRQQVLFAKLILNKAGFDLRQISTGPPPDPVDFASPQYEQAIEKMAELEHGRWNAERIRDGWKPGPRNQDNKTSPYLVPWAQLPEKVKEFDRQAIRDWSQVFESIGLEIYKLKK